MINTYARAYTEVLEILKYLSLEEYSKIPQEKIDFYKKNMEKNYEYKINPNVPLSEQYISKEANAILVSLFRDYFATENQIKIVNNLLNQNQEKLEIIKREKYNSNIFKNRNNNSQEQNITEDICTNEVAMVKYKNSLFKLIIDKIKGIFQR